MVRGCVTTRGRGRQGDISATAKTLLVAQSMPGITTSAPSYSGFYQEIRGWITGYIENQRIYMAWGERACICMHTHMRLQEKVKVCRHLPSLLYYICDSNTLSIGRFKKKKVKYIYGFCLYMSKKTDTFWHVLPFCFRRMKAAACLKMVNLAQKRAQTFEIRYSKFQKIKEICALTLFCVIYY